LDSARGIVGYPSSFCFDSASALHYVNNGSDAGTGDT
jgi:hypothetical protein